MAPGPPRPLRVESPAASSHAGGMEGLPAGVHRAGHVVRFVRRLATDEPEPSLPPPLPPGRIVLIPGRGETFVREQEGPEGALPVLLLHGWTASADLTFFAVYPELRRRHPVIALDHRGHGRGIRAEEPFTLEACADDAAGLLEELGVRRAIVAGYSMGGAISFLLWRRHPQLVAGLVMSGTALEWRTTARERMVWRSLAVLELGLRVSTGEGFVLRYLRQAAEDSPEVAPLRGWVAGESRRGYTPDVVAAGKALAEFGAADYAGSIGVPSATVVTARDRLVLPREQHALATALDSPVFPVDGDHDAPLVKPTEFARAMGKAVASVNERATAADRGG